MRASSFDFMGNLDTLLAVILGAVLATGGALLAEIIQERLWRKRKERDAARFFGEVLTSIDALVDLALSSQKIGKPWGRVTQRFFQTALREAAIYERNRERLFEIRDMQLRFDVHAHFLRETVPITAVLEQTDAIEAAERQLADETLTGAARAALEADLAQEIRDRDLSLEAVIYRRERSSELITRLQTLAPVTFDQGFGEREDAEDKTEASATSREQA